jgi:UDP-2,3-diacylglucosamine pyrophosphatase LpxH
MPSRIVDIESGLVMVVSDLHGDRDAFARHMGRFLQYRSRGRVDKLLILGDLIHSEGAEADDGSLPMLLDVMRTQKSLGADNVMMLLGNHEMPHLYGFTLHKGNFEYTPRFEKALAASGRRDEIIEFLHGLPFYARTAAGVMFAHAGADVSAIEQFDLISNFDHQEVIAEYDHVIRAHPNPDEFREMYARVNGIGLPYEMQARYYLAVEGRDDPRYDDLLRSYIIDAKSREFAALWDVLFTRCEKRIPLNLYQRILEQFLMTLSEGAPAPQNVLVTGHIDVLGGHEVVLPRHLRIASAKHASPREAGQYLLFDAAQPVEDVAALVPFLSSVF